MSTWAKVSRTGARWGWTAWRIEIMHRLTGASPVECEDVAYAWTRASGLRKGKRMARRAHAAAKRRGSDITETAPIR